MQDPLHVRKLSVQGRLNAVVPGALVHIQDQLTNRRYLVDTGASFSIFPHQSAARADGPVLTGPSGKTIPCWGEKTIDLSFNGRRFTWTFLLAAVQFPILGVDFLRHYKLLIDPAANCLVDTRSMQSFATTSSPGISPPAAASSPVLLRVLAVSSSSVPQVAAVATPGIKVPSGSPGADPQAATCGHPAGIAELLDLFSSVVNTAKSLPAVTHDVLHHIVTQGPPISSKFRRLDGEKHAAAKAEFVALERDGVIRRSDSPWASPLHMVRKKDGSWRPCGDFRRLNMVTVPDSYPLPNMMDFSSRMAGCSIFSKIDLRKGYHQIPVYPADVPKTAIITPFGLFEYLRMPFGLRNAGNTFQQMMDRVLAGLDFCFW